MSEYTVEIQIVSLDENNNPSSEHVVLIVHDAPTRDEAQAAAIAAYAQRVGLKAGKHYWATGHSTSHVERLLAAGRPELHISYAPSPIHATPFIHLFPVI